MGYSYTSPFTALDDDTYTRLLDGLVRNEYRLLLGAGASIGAVGGDGTPLPNTKTLITEMSTAFHISSHDDTLSLSDVYELTEHRTESTGRTRDQYLKDRFSDCSPTACQTLLTHIRWRNIWTLNIDDLIEQAYTVSPSPFGQLPNPYHWKYRYKEPSRDTDELQVIHLHGYAPLLLGPEQLPLIFSITEYVQASSDTHSWHRIFGDLFAAEPFIIVGARLRDEYDLAEVLRRGTKSSELTGHPSLVILREILPIQQEQFKSWGLVAIEAPANTFFERLVTDFLTHEAHVASTIPGPRTHTLPPQASIFLDQFYQLRRDKDPIEPKDHDFYAGDEPVWADILNDRDARFSIIDRVLVAIRSVIRANQFSPRRQQLLYCLPGSSGVGKSTALLRISRELLNDGYHIYRFRGDNYLNVPASLWWLTHEPRCILLLDNVSEIATGLDMLVRECKKHNVTMMALAGERTARMNPVYQAISSDVLITGHDYEVNLLSREDIVALIKKLKVARRLGSLTRASYSKKVQHFSRRAGRQLPVAMYELEHGSGFARRVKHEYMQDITSRDAQTAYALMCMSYAFGFPLPLGILCVACGITTREFTTNIQPQLMGITSLDSKGLRPRHRVIASIVIENALTRSDRFAVSQNLAKALSPYVTVDTISQGTLPYRIARSLMLATTLEDWVGSSNIQAWYEGILSEYSWNARYWEQRALAELRSGHYPKARSYAEEGLRLEEHAFGYNTLGTILMRMAIEYYEPESSEAETIFLEGVSNLRKGRDRPLGSSEHPYNTFFFYTLAYAQRNYTHAGKRISMSLTSEWQQWMVKAEQALIYKHPEMHAKLVDYKNQWLRLAVDRDK